MTRCFGDGDPLYEAYHDTEWGVPVRGETALFERLCLEAFQSGLSWLTILRKRESFRSAFDGFEVEKVAAYDDEDVARLDHQCEITCSRSGTSAARYWSRSSGGRLA